jgi:hypothetical protein
MNVAFEKVKRTTKLIGSFSYSDPGSGVSINASKISSLMFNGNHARFTGTAKLTRKSQVTFFVDVIDNGTPGTFDSFSIQVSNGYSAGGTLSSGDISIR